MTGNRTRLDSRKGVFPLHYHPRLHNMNALKPSSVNLGMDACQLAAW